MLRERFAEGDYVLKGQETGRVVKRVSQRTDREYLTVRILSGPRRGLHEFPERGWRIDDGSTTGNQRPAVDTEDYIGSHEHKTEHHSREGQ